MARKTAVQRLAAMGGNGAGAALPEWAEKLTARDWSSIRRAAEECQDEFAMTGSYDPQTIMTSAGYVEVHSNTVKAYGKSINRKAWK